MTMTTPKTPTVPRPQTPIKPLPQTSIRPLAQTTSGGRTSMQDPTASSERLFRGLAKILTLLESYQTTSTRLMDAYTTACRHVATQEEQVSRCHSALVHQHGIYLHVMQQTDNHKLYDLQEKAVAEAQERLEQNVKTLQMAKQHEQRLAATLRNNLDQTLFTISTNLTNVGKSYVGMLTQPDAMMLSSAITRAQQGLQNLGMMSAVGENGLAPSTAALFKGSPGAKKDV